MNLDNITAELRPRSAWEAADFGARLVRRDAVAIYKVWFATSLPLLALAIAMIYLTPWGGWALLAYWWFEPVLDGPILDIVARRLFGGDARVRETIASTPRLAWRNKLFWLTPWRLHFARSTAMPLTQLEGLSGTDRRKRASVLNNHVLNHGIGVTVVYQHLVMVVFFGVLLGALSLIPAEYRGADSFDAIFLAWEGDSNNALAAQLLLFYLGQTLLEPWFVGAGFGLYVNCRTRLEAWDIEVAFRRMAERRHRRPVPGAVALLLFVLAGAGTWHDVHAQDDDADPGFSGYWTDEEIGPELEAVYDDDAFGTTRIDKRWVERNPSKPEVDPSDGDARWLRDALEPLALILSFIAEFGLWILVAVLVLLLYLKRDLWLPYLFVEPRHSESRQRVILSTGEVTAESLPDDVPGTVRALWQRGRHRQALAVLYRASVFVLVDRYGVRLPPSATEGACLKAVNAQAADNQSDYFRELVNAWIPLAYGARRPSDETVERLLNGYAARYGTPA